MHINPIVRDELPRTARDILNRTNEISFNAALLGELRAITFVRRLLAEGVIPEGAMKDVLVHSISDDETMGKLGVATKMNADWTLVRNLKDLGRTAAESFLKEHWSDLGKQASVDLRSLYAG